ncbi:lysine-specific demethylase 6B isoform X2 [Larimichthys crocea]|uniref:lysine-specific demethylase 6B isoform X2 n=1 Tax=Larimichthys crocea TaxID=215358 RepID=UPI000F5EDDBB|nr:lysine-specific demethylase 6B isoform X2 [Larimichthys crocea]
MAPVTRNFTELKLSMGGITPVLTIRTEQDHADQVMDRMLDRVFLQVKADSGDKLGVEPRAEPEEEFAEASGSDPEVSTASPPSRAVNVENMGLWKWAILRPPKASPPPPPPPLPPPPSVDQDQFDVLSGQQSNVSRDASLFSQGSSNSSSS